MVLTDPDCSEEVCTGASSEYFNGFQGAMNVANIHTQVSPSGSCGRGR